MLNTRHLMLKNAITPAFSHLELLSFKRDFDIYTTLISLLKNVLLTYFTLLWNSEDTNTKYLIISREFKWKKKHLRHNIFLIYRPFNPFKQSIINKS